MHDKSIVPELPVLSAKIGQFIRSNELKVAGKLLATARTNLHQLAEKDPKFKAHYEQVAELRNELMEPGEQFDEKRLLVDLLEEEKELHKLVSHHPPEPLLLADAMIKAAAAIVLVYAQDMAADAPLEI
jgi:hypothetical protein